MSSNAATVEVLTAEVRTLMVGSRQVTLSVYRQLDEIPEERFEPFGRVNTSQDPRDLCLVGKDTHSGALTRCAIRKPHLTWSAKELDHLPDWHRYCMVKWPASEAGKYFNVGNGIQFQLSTEAYTPYTPDGEAEWLPPNHSASRTVDETHNEMMDFARGLKQATDQFESWSALPLIVLAGLR